MRNEQEYERGFLDYQVDLLLNTKGTLFTARVPTSEVGQVIKPWPRRCFRIIRCSTGSLRAGENYGDRVAIVIAGVSICQEDWESIS
jgi:hypothetical protein